MVYRYRRKCPAIFLPNAMIANQLTSNFTARQQFIFAQTSSPIAAGHKKFLDRRLRAQICSAYKLSHRQ